MKINTSQLETSLKQKIYPVYLLSGDEPLLLNKAKQQIYAYAKNQGFTHKEIVDIENANNSNSWEKFNFLALNQSLFITQQIIEVRLLHAKLGVHGGKILASYAKNPVIHNLVVLTMPKIDSTTTKTKWFKEIEEHCVFLPIWPLNAHELPTWIAKNAQQLNVKITHNSCLLIAEYTQGNLLATQQELEKLSLLYGNNFITDEQVIASLNNNSRFTCFDLMDVFYKNKQIMPTAKKIALTIEILENLQAEDQEPTIILWAISRELRLWIDCKKNLDNPTQLNKILASYSYKLPPDRQNSIKTISKIIPENVLQHAFQTANEIDYMIKGLNKNNVWTAFQQLIIEIVKFL